MVRRGRSRFSASIGLISFTHYQHIIHQDVMQLVDDCHSALNEIERRNSAPKSYSEGLASFLPFSETEM